MMRWMLLAVLVVVLTTAATVGVQYLPDTTSEGKLAFPNSNDDSAGPPAKAVLVEGGDTTYSFGTFAQYSKGTHVWVIKNEGEGDLKLTQGYKSCSCTIANLKENGTVVVKPGDTTTVELEWNTKEHVGRFNQRAEVNTGNDPHRQKFEFVVSGMVSPALVVIPPGNTIPFQNITSEESHKAHFALFSPDKPDMQITELRTSKPDLMSVTAQPLTEEEKKELEAEAGFQVFLELRPGMPLGEFHEELIVRTNHPKQPEVRMAVVGRVIGPITAMPDRVTLMGVLESQGATKEISLWVRGRDATKFEVAKSPKELQVVIAEVEEKPGGEEKDVKARRYRLTVTVLPGTPPGKIDGSIILKTDHPYAAEVRIPVNITVRTSG